jgi:serine/threonine protein kinase
MDRPIDQTHLSDGVADTPSLAETAPLSGTDPKGVFPGVFEHQALGRYRVIRQLGRGTFGCVYLAEDSALGRQVAVKVTSPSSQDISSGDGPSEAQTLARLDHPSIVPVYDLGSLPTGEHYTVAKYIRGQSLAERISAGPLPPAEAASIVAQVCDGLHHAHGQGIYHRDVKPANILLDDKGQALVADFGLAVSEDQQQTHRGEVSGSPGYMSPEQVRGDVHHLDGRTDIWSVGVILYEALTGKRPFSESSRKTLFEEILGKEPKPPRLISAAIPVELERIALRCLRKEIADRFATAADVADDLREWISPGTRPAVPATPVQESSAGNQRDWLAIGGGITLLLVAAIVISRFAGNYVQSAAKKDLSITPVIPQPAAVPTGGQISLRIWSPQNAARRGRLLDEPGMLPLDQDDQVRVEAELSSPAYAYVLWVDGKGKVSPVYPWTPGDWTHRPATEHRVTKLSLPEQLDTGWELEPSTGMETLLLLGRDEPLPRDVDLKSLLAGLPTQARQDPRSLAWFDNGVPRQDTVRGPRFFDPKRINDPLLATHQALQERLGSKFAFLRAVSFASRSE